MAAGGESHNHLPLVKERSRRGLFYPKQYALVSQTKTPGLKKKQYKLSKMNTGVSGTKQHRDSKCLLLTTLRSNHPLSHGLLVTLVFCCGRPYFRGFICEEKSTEW